MLRTISSKNDAAFWPKVAKGKASEEDWKNFIKSESLSAAVDYPMSLYWKDLMKIYPNAKVLLTVRDPIKWYLSVKNTIRDGQAFMKESILALPIRIFGWLTGKAAGTALFTCNAPTYLGAKYPGGMFGAIDAGQETAVRFFNDWKEQVIQDVPADRLLVFEVKEGWDPLCKFLGVSKPDESFPNTNDTKEQQQRLSTMKKVCYFIWFIGAALTGTAAYFLADYVIIPKITF